MSVQILLCPDSVSAHVPNSYFAHCCIVQNFYGHISHKPQGSILWAQRSQLCFRSFKVCKILSQIHNGKICKILLDKKFRLQGS